MDSSEAPDFEANPLVEASWLAANLDSPELRIVDARWRGGESAEHLYQSGHIPGAVRMDWQADMSHTRFGVDYLILPPVRFAALMGRLGIGDQTRVVAYADLDYSGAARLWWALRYYGHTQVGVLNGGLDRWLAGGYPVEAAIPQPAHEEFTPRPNPALLATVDEIELAVSEETQSIQLVDTRPPEQYAGQAIWTPGGSLFLPQDSDWVALKGRPMRGGRLPGALHLQSSTLLDPSTWTYLDGQTISERARGLGLDPGRRTITYCGCGISASLGLFALHLAGFKDLALFDGSWEEWGRDPDKPIERTVP